MMTDPDDPPWPSPQIKSKGIQSIDSQATAPQRANKAENRCTGS